MGARALLAAAVIVAVAATALVAPAPTYAFGGDGLRAEANKLRVAGGLAPVAGTALLDDIATKRASQMANAGKMEHDLSYVTSRLNSGGVCWSSVGEIIAWANYPSYSYERTMQQWWNSSTHKAILMTAGYNAAGGAWQRSSGSGDYSVMIFVKLCGSDTPTTLSSSLQVSTAYDPDRKVYFAAGYHTGYQLTDAGKVVGSKKYRLGRASSAPAGGRTYVNGRAYLLITQGVWGGYWVLETSRSYVMGVAYQQNYASSRTLYFAAGQYTGYKYDSSGHAIASKTYALRHGSSAPVSAAAVINGRTHFLVTAGIWKGYWVRLTTGLRIG